MKQIILIALTLGIGLSTGCQSKPKIVHQPQLEVMMPSQIAGTTVPATSIERIRNPENLRAYYLNRYIDPNNSDIMYGKTILYRVEENSSWNLRPNAEVNFPIGQDTKRADYNSMKPLVAEFNSEVQKQKEFSNQLKNANKLNSDMARRQQIFMQQNQKEQKKLQQNEKVLKQKVAYQDQTITELKKQLTKLQYKLEKLEEKKAAEIIMDMREQKK